MRRGEGLEEVVLVVGRFVGRSKGLRRGSCRVVWLVI